MTSSRSTRRSSVASTVVRALPLDESDPLRWFWLALVSGLFFVRWWQPTEGTSLGGTLPIALGWFLALTLAGWLGMRGTAWRIRWDGLLGAVCLLAAGHIISGLVVVATTGDRRAAINLIWEWASLAVVFPLLRSAVATPQARRDWTVVALAAALTLGSYGLTQRFVFYPQMVQQYERLRQELDTLEQTAASGGVADVQRMQKLQAQMLGNGISAHMLSGSGRTLLEGRLKHSSEPLGRFALANTFAGLLLVWWVLVVFQTIQTWWHRPAPGELALSVGSRPSGDLLRLGGLLFCLAVMGYCLLLTKSRTAYVGSAFSLVVWSLAGQSKWLGNWRKLALWGLAVGVGVAGIALVAGMTGGLDRLVLAEAPKSLQYRLEYWWGSLQVIAESPLIGAGPGQFRQHYLAHKLPRSSEEIADPHNLVLDVWANGGLIALVGLIWLVVCIARSLRPENGPRKADSADNITPTQSAPAIPLARSVAESGVSPRPAQKIPQPKVLPRKAPVEAEVTAGVAGGWSSPIVWGGLIGLLSLWLVEGALETSLLGFLAAWMIAILFIESILPREAIRPLSWGAAGLGLLVHLCGAGGIAMPAITQLLVFVAIFAIQGRSVTTDVTLPKWSYGIVLAGGIGLFCGGFWTAAQPVAQVQSLLARADFAKLTSQREQLYQQATQADPWAAEPWERLAEILFAQWRSTADADEAVFQRAVAAQQAAIERNPLIFHTHRALGMLYTEHAVRSGSQEEYRLAVQEMETAVRRYPHNAELRATAAEVFSAAGEAALATVAAKRALEQDQINHAAGHTDKWLADKVRQRMEQLAVEH